MRLTICLFLLSGCATLSAWAQALDAQARIELRPEVVVQQRQVLLGDVANVYTNDLATIQRLVALPLGQAPRTGEDATVQREAIARWVRVRLGMGAEQLAWRGAAETHLRTLAREVPAATIERAGRVALGQWLAERSTRYELEALGPSRDVTLPAGKLELSARPLALNGEPTSRMVVWLDAHVDGVFAKSIPVSFAVQAYRDAWVAAAPVAEGASLTPGLVEKREVDIQHRGIAAMPATNSAFAPGLRTKRALKAGEPLTTHNAAPAPAVARGDWVNMHLKSGGVDLDERAQVLQDGQLGQVVKVKSAAGPAPVAARVVAPGHVEALL